MLHAPDFLGYASAIELAKDHRELVERALHMKKTGNEVMRVVGGREIHPINVKVGGFYRVPTRPELARARAASSSARASFALETVRFTAGLDFPDFEQDYELVAARPTRRPTRSRTADWSRTAGSTSTVSEYEQHFVEEHVEWSNALHSHTIARRQLPRRPAGPLGALRRPADAARRARRPRRRDSTRDERNPFRTIVVRSVELVYAADEALRLIAEYEPPERPFVEVVPRAGVGYGCSEAPRGICWHRYELDDEGTILAAKIVPPTSQNQATIESDLRGVVERYADLPDAELSLRCEQSIRNYDPCISCATHFLKLEVDRG